MVPPWTGSPKGPINVGDEVLAINGVDVKPLSHEEVVEIITSSTQFTLVVKSCESQQVLVTATHGTYNNSKPSNTGTQAVSYTAASREPSSVGFVNTKGYNKGNDADTDVHNATAPSVSPAAVDTVASVERQPPPHDRIDADGNHQALTRGPPTNLETPTHGAANNLSQTSVDNTENHSLSGQGRLLLAHDIPEHLGGRGTPTVAPAVAQAEEDEEESLPPDPITDDDGNGFNSTDGVVDNDGKRDHVAPHSSGPYGYSTEHAPAGLSEIALL